jgi:hypothetical protein
MRQNGRYEDAKGREMADYLMLEPEEIVKRKHLTEALEEARRRLAMVAQFGTIEEVHKADAEVGAILWEIKQIDGTTDKHWMAS